MGSHVSFVPPVQVEYFWKRSMEYWEYDYGKHFIKIVAKMRQLFIFNIWWVDCLQNIYIFTFHTMTPIKMISWSRMVKWLQCGNLAIFCPSDFTWNQFYLADFSRSKTAIFTILWLLIFKFWNVLILLSVRFPKIKIKVLQNG